MLIISIIPLYSRGLSSSRRGARAGAGSGAGAGTGAGAGVGAGGYVEGEAGAKARAGATPSMGLFSCCGRSKTITDSDSVAHGGPGPGGQQWPPGPPRTSESSYAGGPGGQGVNWEELERATQLSNLK